MKKWLIVLFSVALVSCGNDKTGEKEKTATAIDNLTAPVLSGTIIYKNTCVGDEEGVNAFKSFAPTEYAVSVNNNRVRFKEIGGIVGTNLLLNFNDSIYYQLDDAEGTYKQVFRKDYSHQFKEIELEKTTESEVILGHSCTKYVVKSSPFVGENTKQSLWITRDFNYPYDQGKYVGSGNYAGILPLMVISDVGFGTILKAESIDEHTTVTMEAVLLETETLEENFEIPDNYKIVE